MTLELTCFLVAFVLGVLGAVLVPMSDKRLKTARKVGAR